MGRADRLVVPGLAVWPWTGGFAFLGLKGLICSMGAVMPPCGAALRGTGRRNVPWWTQAHRPLNDSGQAHGKRSLRCPSEHLPVPRPQGLDCDDGFLGEAVPGFPVCHGPSYLRGQQSVAQVSGRETCLGLGLHPQSQSLGAQAPAARVVQGSRGPSGTDTHRACPQTLSRGQGRPRPSFDLRGVVFLGSLPDAKQRAPTWGPVRIDG